MRDKFRAWVSLQTKPKIKKLGKHKTENKKNDDVGLTIPAPKTQ